MTEKLAMDICNRPNSAYPIYMKKEAQGFLRGIEIGRAESQARIMQSEELRPALSHGDALLRINELEKERDKWKALAGELAEKGLFLDSLLKNIMVEGMPITPKMFSDIAIASKKFTDKAKAAGL